MSAHPIEISPSSYSNPRGKLDQATVAGMNRRVEAQIARFRQTGELSRKIAPTGEEKAARKAAREKFLEGVGIKEDAAARLKASRQKRLHDVIATRDSAHQSYGFPTQQDQHDGPGALEMWWAQTSWWGSAGSLSVSWQDDGPHFSGVVHVNDDDLQTYNLTFFAQFELGADRIPNSARGMVVSEPFANVYGKVYAICKDFSLWDAFDDQWAKCWLNLRQTVWVTIPGLNLPIFGNRLPIASNSSSRSIVFLESMDIRDTYLPGHITVPPVEFNLSPNISKVEIDLEFSFDLQLEGGDSNLVFGQDSDWPSNVVQTLQWKLARK